MPELPEVETIRRDLDPGLRDARIVALWSSGKALRLRREPPLEALAGACIGRRVSGVRRQGKYLLVDVQGPSARGARGVRRSYEHGAVVVVHLGMSGRLRLVAGAEPRAAHTHIVWTLEDGRELRFVDPRRFGTVLVAAAGHERELPELAILGIDPLGPELTSGWLLELARASRRDVKSLLLDQTHLAGLGNIYVCEALHEAKVHPAARAQRLGPARVESLRAAIRSVLTRGIANRGTSFRDYVDADGNSGSNQRDLHVYGREGEPCLRGDGGVVSRSVMSGRSTFFCPVCQRR